MKRKTFAILGVVLFLFQPLSFSESQESVTAREILEMLLQEKPVEKKLFVDKTKIVEELRAEFEIQDEDLAFIMSIRAARIPVDGFDFFLDSKALLQLVYLYLEVKEKWGKPITTEFYDFFKDYASNRMKNFGSGGTAYSAIEYHFQLEEAKKRFKMP